MSKLHIYERGQSVFYIGCTEGDGELLLQEDGDEYELSGTADDNFKAFCINALTEGREPFLIVTPEGHVARFGQFIVENVSEDSKRVKLVSTNGIVKQENN